MPVLKYTHHIQESLIFNSCSTPGSVWLPLHRKFYSTTAVHPELQKMVKEMLVTSDRSPHKY
jgi:hypothetical protein